MSSLLNFAKPVLFNPENKNHLRAYARLLEGKQGDLRFELEFPHKSVLAMMERKIAVNTAHNVTGRLPVDVSSMPFYQRICYAG